MPGFCDQGLGSRDLRGQIVALGGHQARLPRPASGRYRLVLHAYVQVQP